MQNETKRKKILLGIGVLLAICLIIGVSYAYWRLVLHQTGENEVASSCFSITLTNEQNAINLQKAYPILDEEGKELTPYTFTVKNNCDAYASYSVNLELLETILEENRLSSGFIKVMLDENTPLLLTENTSIEPTLDNAYEAYELATGYLDANASVTYNLRLWMNQDVTIEDNAMNKQLESKITITASYVDHMPTDYEKCVEEYGEDSIQCSIIANADTTGSCPTVNEDGTISITDIEDAENLVCSAPDDYGTSYYFRGNVTNNYVKFAGYYWRILRINGNGSIRILYDGTVAHQNGESSIDRQIGESAFNENDNDNAYVGYMYGTPGSSTYEDTHANINDSTLKTVVDNWYKINIEETGYGSYVSDTLFCNDRSFSSSNTGTGIGTSKTEYRGFDAFLVPYNLYQLKCVQKNDRFTVNDEVIGNGALTYPVGLFSIDELRLSGENTCYYWYSYSGDWCYTMTPYSADYINGAFMTPSRGEGEEFEMVSLADVNGVRPVINLKPNSLKSGDGTALNPYTVEENI